MGYVIFVISELIKAEMLKKAGKYILLLFIITSISCSSCNNSKQNEEDPWENLEDVIKTDDEVGADKQIGNISDVIDNVSSPVEMAALILDLGIPYSNDYLAETKNADSYNTALKKAINLGVFGADLGYLNMYNQTSVVMNYISVIKDMADGIRVGQFFDFTTLKRLVLNNTNLDSLMLISQQSFNRMDQYLRENNRRNLSTLIIAGVWIEGMYLVTQVAKDNPHEKIKDAIGDQKSIVTIILGLLNNYKKEVFFKELTTDFNDLKRIFDEVKITIEYTDPQPVEIDGVLEFKSAEVSIIDISDETLNKIIEKIASIRNNIISV